MSKVNNFTRGEWAARNSDCGTFNVILVNGKPKIDNEPRSDYINLNSGDFNLIATAGTTASKLADMGYDAVKLIEDYPLILIKVLKGDVDGALRDIEYLKVQ
jgi:hypothetical protein